MKKFILPILAVISVGCTDVSHNDSKPEVSPVSELIEFQDLINEDSETLDATDAVKVASLFQRRENDCVSRANYNIGIPDIRPILNEVTGVPIMYVVNWPNNGGFVVVSATKMATPILAYSETGNFDAETDSPALSLLESLKAGLSYVIENPADSLLQNNAIGWDVYENHFSTSMLSRALSTEMQQKMQQKISKMKAAGWNYVGNITAARYRMPDSEYQALYRDAMQFSDQQYDIEEVSLCFIKDERMTTVGPLLTSSWDQNITPYNLVAILDYGISINNQPKAGCTPLAIAQIANYHKFPTKYKWEELFVEASNGIQYNLHELMKDISDFCDAEFYAGKTSVAKGKDVKAFQQMGFQDVNECSVSFQTMVNRISTNNPIFMRGHGSEGGHSWVCDGYQERRFPGVISVVANSMVPKFEMDTETGYYDINFYYNSTSQSASLPDYFHMNMGNGEDGGDGWYHYFNNSMNIPKYPNDQNIIPVTVPK